MCNFIFPVECSQISLLPNENVRFSSHSPSDMDVWCPGELDLFPYAILTFAEPHYLLYAIVSENDFTYFSLTYKNLSGESVTYMNVDGFSVRYFIIHEL